MTMKQARVPTARYHQSANAALQVRDTTRVRHCVLVVNVNRAQIQVLLWTKPRGFLATGAQIMQRETPLALYKGLGAVLSGIVPKMSIRFASFEQYKKALADSSGKTSTGGVFLGALRKRLVLSPSQ